MTPAAAVAPANQLEMTPDILEEMLKRVEHIQTDIDKLNEQASEEILKVALLSFCALPCTSCVDGRYRIAHSSIHV